jgi:cellulose biosynthesis protein BcsQ
MIITILGFKDGVGKPTTAVHLAAYLQEVSSSQHKVSSSKLKAIELKQE